MSLSTIKQRVEDYSIALTSTNSGFDSDGVTRFLNDAMLDGAKDVVNRIGVISPETISKFTLEFEIKDSNGINSDFITPEISPVITYVNADITTIQQVAIAVTATGGFSVDDYIIILNTHQDTGNAMTYPDTSLMGPEIMKIKALAANSSITVERGEFGSVKQTFAMPSSGTASVVNPKIHKITKLVPIGKVIYAEIETQDRWVSTRRYPLSRMQPHITGRFTDPGSLLYQSKYNGVYAETDNKIRVYPPPSITSLDKYTVGKIHAVTYGDIYDFENDVDNNTRDYFPEEHLNQVIIFAAIKSFVKVMAYMKNRLLDYSLPAMGALPVDISIGTAPIVDSPEDVALPETTINITETLGNITFPDSFPLEELDVGSPVALNDVPSFPNTIVSESSSDHADSTTVDDPTSVTFPASPSLPSMDELPEFPTLGAIGQVTGDISDIEITIPTLSTIDAGAAPTTPTGLQDTFKPEWMGDGQSADYTAFTSWGHNPSDGDGVPGVQWSFEHQIVKEEDPEMAALRLRQMEVEVEKFTKSQDTLARVYVAETQAYAEKIRAEIAKITGEAQIAAEEARAKRTILEAESSKIQAEASIVQSEVQANQAIIQAYSAEVGAKVNKFAMETKAKTDAFVGEVRGLTTIYQTEAQFNIGKFNAQIQKDLNVYVANVRRKLQIYTANIQGWQAEVSSILQRWVSQEWQTKIVKWQIESTGKIQEYQSKVGQNVQKYAQEIAVANGKTAYEIKRYGSELQKLSQQNQLDFGVFQTQSQTKMAEWNRKSQWSMQRWAQDLSVQLQKYGAEFQKTLAVYQAETQGSLQEHNMKLNNLNIEYQWIGQQMQILTNMYNASFVPYQQQQQQPAPQMVQRR